MTVGTPAQVPPGWRTECCDRVPRPIGGIRYVCVACGAIETRYHTIIRKLFFDQPVATPVGPRVMFDQPSLFDGHGR